MSSFPPRPEKVVQTDMLKVKAKGKTIPLQAWIGPEFPGRLRFPDFKTIGTRRW